MRNLRRILALLVVLCLALAAAAGAAAKKPAPPPEEPGVGMTCAELSADLSAGISFAIPHWNDPKSFTVELNQGLSACVDVLSMSGVWQIDVNVGSARDVGLAVHDSVMPGDTCWGRVTLTESGTVYTSAIPAAAIDACGAGEADGAASLTFNAGYRGRGNLREPVTITVTLP